MTAQLVTPNPNIWCRPGWCLQYVREAFGIAQGVQPTATAGWNASPTQHRDRDFPAGVWHPVWFSLRNVPAGHVALRAPWGAVYSTSDDNNTPHCHPDLDDLINYYNRYGQPITYLGWTEDIENVTVIDTGSLSYDGETATPMEEDDMYTDADRARDTLTAERVTYLWDTYGPGKSEYKTEGEMAGVIRAGARDAAAALNSVTPGEFEKRPAGATIQAMVAIAANSQGKTVSEIVDGVTEKLGAGIEFVLQTKQEDK